MKKYNWLILFANKTYFIKIIVQKYFLIFPYHYEIIKYYNKSSDCYVSELKKTIKNYLKLKWHKEVYIFILKN